MVPFYHFTAAYKKATLRKVHSRKRIVLFSETLEFFFRCQASVHEHIGLGLFIFSPRECILFLHEFSVRRLLWHVGTIHQGHDNRCYCWDHPVGPWTKGKFLKKQIRKWEPTSYKNKQTEKSLLKEVLPPHFNKYFKFRATEHLD